MATRKARLARKTFKKSCNEVGDSIFSACAFGRSLRRPRDKCVAHWLSSSPSEPSLSCSFLDPRKNSALSSGETFNITRTENCLPVHNHHFAMSRSATIESSRSSTHRNT